MKELLGVEEGKDGGGDTNDHELGNDNKDIVNSLPSPSINSSIRVRVRLG